ncbi:hypothetical protein AJ79_08732 [Helicocarpus griseus UAMH5409]|uniref:Uncharacterized protein n=1 Tax=Helicocarpus griseus UAMH5409 TaxID=1447875 RepID=A0A2B7WR34_9EURO|nr:hypothetical protein AJ79_08732 [Helicocarpus griseus UAMH5409]
MNRYLSIACLVLAFLIISVPRANGRIIAAREHRRIYERGRNIEVDNGVNARPPYGHIAGAVAAAPPSHNGVAFKDGSVVINVISSEKEGEAHGQISEHVPALVPVHSPALIDFQSAAHTPVLVPIQSAEHTPSPIPFRSAADSQAIIPIQTSSTPPVPAVPFPSTTAQVQQANIAADACTCYCLCPFHNFNIPAVNLATTLGLGGFPTATTLATVDSDAGLEVQPSDTAPITSFSTENGAETAGVAPSAFPEGEASTTAVAPVPSETGAGTPTEAAVAPDGNAAAGAVETVSNISTATNEALPSPAPAAPTEGAATVTDAAQPAATDADATQGAGPSADSAQSAVTEATVTAEAAASITENPATVTDADFTQGVTEDISASETATATQAAETDADSRQAAATREGPAETAAPEADPAAVSFDISTMSLHSALTLRLGG